MKINQCTEDESEIVANAWNCKVVVKDTTYLEAGPYYAYCTSKECQIPFDDVIDVFSADEVEIIEWRK